MTFINNKYKKRTFLTSQSKKITLINRINQREGKTTTDPKK
jgi:hypothetical protein